MGRSWGKRRIVLVGVVVAGLVLSACSSDGDDSSSSTSTTAANVKTKERPAGPAAELTELSGGDGVFIGAANPTALPKSYVEEEFTAAGTATSYTSEGDLSTDGRWTLQPDQPADYKTRV